LTAIAGLSDSRLTDHVWTIKELIRKQRSVIPYDRHNPIHIAIVTFALFGSLFAIGYIALLIKDDNGQFRITTVLALTAAVAISIVVVRLLLLIPI
jgi:hypothetical protein